MKNKGCTLDVKLRQMVAWTCVSHICFNRMMKTEAGKEFKLCNVCQKLYREGRNTLHITLLGIGRDWDMKRLNNVNGRGSM